MIWTSLSKKEGCFLLLRILYMSKTQNQKKKIHHLNHIKWTHNLNSGWRCVICDELWSTLTLFVYIIHHVMRCCMSVISETSAVIIDSYCKFPKNETIEVTQ